MDKNVNPVKNSTKKYLNEITFLHFLHFPLRNKYEIKGMLSNTFTVTLQFGQNDLPFDICLSSGNL